MTRSAHGIRLPALGFGTWRLTGSECRDAVADALAMGYRHIDTARIYQNEREVGDGWKRSGVARSDFFLTTKLWTDRLTPAGVAESARASLSDLQTDYVDLLLIHWPNPDVPLEDTLGAMLRLRDEGLTRAVGVSNFPPSLFERAAELAPVVTNQVEYHPLLGQDRLLEAIRARGSTLTAYKPLARGLVAQEEVVQEIAQAHGCTPEQVVLRWFLEQPDVIVIPKAASPKHRSANFEVLDLSLTPDEVARIGVLDRGERTVDPDFAPDWEA
jgi:2,5-diketo-D-gluconate reductase B